MSLFDDLNIGNTITDNDNKKSEISMMTTNRSGGKPTSQASQGNKKKIKELQVGEKAEGYYKLLKIDKRTKKDGGSFLTLELMDNTGKIAAKVWSKADHYFKQLKEGEVYRFHGYINEYMNRKEIKVDAAVELTAADTGYNPEDFQEKAAFDTGQLFDQMTGLLKSNITNPYLTQLVDLFIQEYGETFKSHYGAQKIHHAYMGGLLEHTYSIIKLAIALAEHYSLDRDLLLTGALFHDLGKMYEFKVSPSVQATIEGGLLGHLVIGNSKFLELKGRISDFPEDLSIKIQHLIVSHHGEKEFGSPEVPKIPEAFVLHYLDLMDSKLKILTETIENTETKGHFSDYVNVLARRVFIPQKDTE
jgi:3'-5' exoribonuclease